ncbi:EF-hand domain-containing protein [Methylorubrum suomiense]
MPWKLTHVPTPQRRPRSRSDPADGRRHRPAFAQKSSVITALDPDKDGTLDLKEVQAAASAKFDALDPDKDGTLDKKELKGVLSPKLFKSGDPDMDGTIDKKEYLALVEALFKDADPDNDGTLDAKELKTKPGKALIKLIK